jgi:hypothetical protein
VSEQLIRRVVWELDEVLDMVLRNDITDSITVIAVLLADRERRRSGRR